MRLDIMVSVSTNIFYEAKFDIYQTDIAIFLFRFLRINLGGGTSYHDLCRDMRINVNRPRLMVELWTSRPIKIGSLGSKRSKILEISY